MKKTISIIALGLFSGSMIGVSIWYIADIFKDLGELYAITISQWAVAFTDVDGKIRMFDWYHILDKIVGPMAIGVVGLIICCILCAWFCIRKIRGERA